MNLNIGSGDVKDLLSGFHTKSYKSLIEKFYSNEKPYYNALRSPIDQLRTGAILEKRYIQVLPDGYFSQFNVRSKSMDVLSATLDFPYIDKGVVLDFDELKSIWWEDFINIVQPLKNKSYDEYINVIKSKYKNYYNQVQEQLYCSDLPEANLVFLAVYTYNDEENYKRDIKANEYLKFRIKQDKDVISTIEHRASIFQLIKDYYTK